MAHMIPGPARKSCKMVSLSYKILQNLIRPHKKMKPSYKIFLLGTYNVILYRVRNKHTSGVIKCHCMLIPNMVTTSMYVHVDDHEW